MGFDGFIVMGFMLVNLSGGFYEFSIIDNMGIVVFIYEFIIEEVDSLFELVFFVIIDFDCDVLMGVLFSLVIGGIFLYQYLFNGFSSIMGDYNGLVVGNYFLEIMDVNGCGISVDIMVIVLDVLEIDLFVFVMFCDEFLEFFVGMVGIYEWFIGVIIVNIMVDIFGFYFLIVMNVVNCFVMVIVEVVFGEVLVVMLDNDFLEICFGDML